MLNSQELTALFDRLGMPPDGRKLVLKARQASPVRVVTSRGGNVITYFGSRKMGCSVATESRHLEFPAVVAMEYDPQVLEFYAQPCELKLELVEETTGEIRSIRHFPDFLVVREDGFTLEEWKDRDKLSRLAERYPYRYVLGADGRWRAPQIEEQLAAKGIRYRIRTDADVPRRRVENLLHLADYYHPATTPCEEQILLRLRAALKEHGALYVSELLSAPYSFKADDIWKAVADHMVVANLEREDLTQPSRCRLYRDTALRDFMAGEVAVRGFPGRDNFVFEIAAGMQFRYEGQVLSMALVGEREVVCSRGEGGEVTLTRDWLAQAFERGDIEPESLAIGSSVELTRYSERQLQEAVRRSKLLAQNPEGANVSERTLRRWRASQEAAALNGNPELLALVPRTDSRGNRSARLSDEQEAVVSQNIDKQWRTTEAKNYRACYRALVNECNARGIRPPSYPTLIARIKAVETAHDLRTRHGRRIAYQQGTFVDVLYPDTPVHGSRPFQYVHIDHTELDIELISSRTGKPLGRPWLSFAVDAWSRRVVALYLSFDSPSYVSVMMVLRDMVRRFQRLPEMLILDNGPDFRSEALKSFLVAMSVDWRYRPASRPRHGAVLERRFGAVHSQYIHNLAGNTKATKQVRMVTGKHLPVNFAEWTLEAMYYGIQHWACEFYDQEPHQALGCSPREAYHKGVREAGARSQRHVSFCNDFLIATCPPCDREGARRVNLQRGVKVNGLHYWHPAFNEHDVAGRKLPVRYDPWDASSVYVRVKNCWVRAQCRALAGLGQLTDVERRALTEEYVRRTSATLDETANHRLREFMQVFTPEGALATARDRQAENKGLYNALELSSVMPVAPAYKPGLPGPLPHANWDGVTTAEPHTQETSAEMPAPDALPDFDCF